MLHTILIVRPYNQRLLTLYPPIDVLDLSLHFSLLKKRQRRFQEAENEDVTSVVAHAEQRLRATPAGCQVGQRRWHVFHAVHAESFDVRCCRRGEEVQAPFCK